ncbi:DUF262 domain-containing protein [Pontibacter sp. SGAir0037]|uniref:DUF262 domain-containing protein n=1 Tax=Pontibacter sp. SGAir0037 TaxID=2571030 RepID=UPI0010CCB5D9|nr:DUF262 domain-containing protein [Pontibacter sp. SGAir0037]QCR25198.1 DUF262 domain-containing protein [Pontibacter sp. SGAir0037]
MNKIEKLEKRLEKTRNSLNTDRLDMSFGEIMSMYERAEIIIDPDFQRLFRWDTYQKTRFIESILIGIPVPPIFVAEDEDGRWELVDGLQRISTVFSFFGVLKDTKDKNNWVMCKGDLTEELEHLACKDLPLKFQLNIKRATCRIEIIKWNSAFDMRYELFNRLNTGGSELTDQEIRNAIFRGVSKEFNIFLRDCAKNDKFVQLIQPTERQLEQLYMDELVLRFCSLTDGQDELSENISQHMTNYMKKAVSDDERIFHLKNSFENMINLLHPVGRDVFRGSNNVFSTSLYDCVSIGITKYYQKYKDLRTDELIAKVNQLKESQSFKKASGSASASKSRILKRIEVADEIFG